MSPRIFPLIASLPLLFCLGSQFTNGTITDTIKPGQSLNTSDLLSAYGSFGLGFISTENSTKHYVVILQGAYTSYIDHESVVWVANREHPFPNSSAVLTFNSDGNLVISDGRLEHVLTNTSGHGNDTYARLLETGNLILTNRASDILWQSFDYPTHTLLPGMKLKDAKTGWSLTSWKNDDDPAPGLFSLQYLASRKELILMEGSEPYWTSSLSASAVLADLFVIDGEYITWRSKSSPNEIRRIRLDISGNLLLQTFIMRDMYYDWHSFCLPGFERGTDLQYSNNIYCTTTDTIRPGQSLSTSETIGSVNGMYELGFFSPKESTKYYVGIWYNKVSDPDVVWVANREDPFPNSSAVLTFNPDGNLVMSNDDRWLQVLTNASGGNDTYARLLDTGNLILTNRASDVLWQSFDYPTDSFLPGMKIKYDNDRPVLASWRSDDDPGVSFMLHVGSLKELIMLKWFEPVWSSPLIGGQADIFVIDGDYITLNDNYTSTITSTENYTSTITLTDIRRVALLATGELQLQTWSYGYEYLNLSGPIRCRAYAHCGEFSICNDAAYVPCDCLPGFEGYATEGRCKRKTELQCSDGFRRISKVYLPSNYQQLQYVGNASECESDCLNNCSCTGYAYDDQEHRCLVWEGPLLNLKNYSEDDTYKQDFYLKLAPQDLVLKGISDTNSTNGTVTGNNQLRKIVIPSTASIAVVVTLGLCVYYVRRKLRRKGPSGEDLLLLELGTTRKANNSEHGDSREREVQMPLFSFASVSAATNNFSAANKLGEGGFGPVYKGILLKGDEVAVKRLSKRSRQGWEELKNEAMLIAKLQHKNLVRLLGCCIERDEKILVYEYMPNKSLDFFLFDQEKRQILDWRTRVRVIEGIAQGLLYLHQYSRLKIIHRDLKPSNILLNIDMNPKISDFGMARIFGGNKLQANTNRIVGTYGYMSPEYALEGLFSIKSDVFSFGVLLLEIVSGKKNTGFYQTDSLHLIGYAWELWTSDRGSDLVDPLLDDISPMQMVLRYVNIALLCVQENAEDRPIMSDVVAMLSNETAVLPYPKEPAFLNVRSMSKAKPVNSRPQICSLNGATISIMEGR